MQCARQQFLACAALPQQQSRHICWRYLFDHTTDRQHAFAGGDNTVQRRVNRYALQATILCFEFANIECALDK